jgi:hypothetical protein
MYYNARFYDPYLNHFTQPDSIVPDPSNSQDWDRYSYARNNPLRYTDPTGHRNCEEDGYHCPGWAITPGQLIQESYEKYGSKESFDISGKLKEDIEDYMSSHPAYSSDNDPYLAFSIGHNRRLQFEDLRLQYWQERLKDSGVCTSKYFCLDQATLLYKRYDLHQENLVGGQSWSSDKVNWPSVTLDIAGIPLSLVGVGRLTPTSPWGARLLKWAGFVDSTTSLASSNNPMYRLIVLGSYVPVAGAFFSANLLVWDLDAGTYNIPYTPPISR